MTVKWGKNISLEAPKRDISINSICKKKYIHETKADKILCIGLDAATPLACKFLLLSQVRGM